MTSAAFSDLQLEMQPCGFCGSDAFEQLARQDRHLLGLRTVGCRVCGLLQTNPRPTRSSLHNFYSQDYRTLYQGITLPSQDYIAAHKKTERLRYTANFLLKHLSLTSRSRLLDYGCSEGSLFLALRQSGFKGQLVGVEPNDAFRQYAATQGNAIVLSALNGEQRFDVVVVNHVLEHVTNPLDLLRQLAHSALPGGKIYIDVPDAEEYHHVGDFHIAHLFHFTERTLASLVEAGGFAVEFCAKHRPPHHPASVQLIAARVAPVVNRARTTAASEREVWSLVRALDAKAWRWVMRRRLSRIRGLRAAYHCFRRLLVRAKATAL